MPRLANASKGQISEDECPALEAFMLSLWCGYLWRAATEIFVHIEEAPSLKKNFTESGKLLKLHCFPWRTHGVVLSLSHYRPHKRVQPLKKLPKWSHKGTLYICMKTTPGEECLCPTGIKGGRNRHGALIQNILTYHSVCKNTLRSP